MIHRSVYILLMLTFFAGVAVAQDDLVIGELPQPGEQLYNYTFYDYALEIHKLDDLRGRPAVLVFWQAGDENSKALLRQISTLEFDSEDGPQRVAISLAGKTGQALFEITRMNLENILFLDGDRRFLAEQYGITGVPTIFVIDGEGKLIKAFLGADERTASRIRSALQRAQ